MYNFRPSHVDEDSLSSESKICQHSLFFSHINVYLTADW